MAIGVVTGIAGLAMWLGPVASANAASLQASATCTPGTGNPFCPDPPGTGNGNNPPPTNCSNPVVCPQPPTTPGGRLGAVEQELNSLAQRFPALAPVVSEIDNLITTISERGGGGTGRFR